MTANAKTSPADDVVAKVGMKSGPRRDTPSRANTRRHRAAWGGGMLISVLFHVLVFLVWPAATIHLFSGARDDTHRTFETLEAIRLVRLAAPARQPAAVAAAETASEAAPQTATPRLARQIPAVAVRGVASSPASLDLTPARRIGEGSGIALLAPGETSGSREGEFETVDDGYVEPIAKNILPEWRPSRSLYDVVVTARARLDAAGHPTGPVELVPPTESQRVNRQIMTRVRTLEYEPARRGGEPVAAWAEITFVFCGMNVTATSPAPPTISAAPCEAAVAETSEAADEAAARELGR